MKKIILTIAALIFIILPQTTQAAEFKFFNEGSGVISKNGPVKNLYTGGNSVTTNADVQGDLAIFGNSLTINGKVEDDLFAAANTINIKGDIGKNVRIAGSTITVESSIGGDLLSASGVIETTSNSKINGDVLIAGGTVTLNGKIDGYVKVSAETLIINGEINGDVLAKNVNNLKIKDNSKINGKLIYYSPKKGEISNLAQISGGVTYNETKTTFAFGYKPTAADIFFKIISSFIVLLVLIYGFNKFASNINSDTSLNFWTNLGWGLITLIITPIVALLLALSIVGVKIAFILALAYIAYLTIASVFVPLFVGEGIIKLATKNKEHRIDWLSALIGVVATLILAIIPVIGWFVIFILFLASFGALTKLSYNKIKS